MLLIDKYLVTKEVSWLFSRSQGAGGQNVNKVETRVSLKFDFMASAALNDAQKQRLSEKFGPAEIVVHCQKHRSQHKNRELAVDLLLQKLQKALEIPKDRKATKPTAGSLAQKLITKKTQSQRKLLRKKVEY